ncbi:hypothetical protein [Leptolyngbya iicbica]|nr:hypothetical protein [Leptolyngbya sp. LK]
MRKNSVPQLPHPSRHRLILGPEAQLDGLTTDAVITALLQQVPVPR